MISMLGALGHRRPAATLVGRLSQADLRMVVEARNDGFKSAGNEAGNGKGQVTRLTTYAMVSTVRTATVAQEMML
jgi:hypothetical protein